MYKIFHFSCWFCYFIFLVILFNIDFDRFLAVRLPVFGECNGVFSQLSNTNFKFNLKHFIAFNFITTAQLYKSTKCFVQNSIAKVQKLVKIKFQKCPMANCSHVLRRLGHNLIRVKQNINFVKFLNLKF